ncbi:MAG: hypothetical protein MJE68_12040, partial [Proteobacteria bacterium]|nr:hypothetical protein [Pseudomonadota bacterium]
MEDTVKPKLGMIQPFNGAIVTENRPLRVVAEVSDIGVESERLVNAEIIREYQDESGDWVVENPLHRTTIPLIRNDLRNPGDLTPVSDPDNHYYIYWADFVDGNVLTRSNNLNERLRIETTVSTQNHTVNTVTLHEVGLDISEKRFLYPADPVANNHLSLQQLADDVYYSAVDQFSSANQTGAMMAAWTRLDPMRQEQGLGNLGLQETKRDGTSLTAWTGLFILDDDSEQLEQDGNHYVYSGLTAGSAEIFKGSINEIHTDRNLVLAGKSGVFIDEVGDCKGDGCDFVEEIQDEINLDTETGHIYDENASGELLLFTVKNEQGSLGIPYSLTEIGRA